MPEIKRNWILYSVQLNISVWSFKFLVKLKSNRTSLIVIWQFWNYHKSIFAIKLNRISYSIKCHCCAGCAWKMYSWGKNTWNYPFLRVDFLWGRLEVSIYPTEKLSLKKGPSSNSYSKKSAFKSCDILVFSQVVRLV